MCFKVGGWSMAHGRSVVPSAFAAAGCLPYFLLALHLPSSSCVPWIAHLPCPLRLHSDLIVTCAKLLGKILANVIECTPRFPRLGCRSCARAVTNSCRCLAPSHKHLLVFGTPMKVQRGGGAVVARRGSPEVTGCSNMNLQPLPDYLQALASILISV